VLEDSILYLERRQPRVLRMKWTLSQERMISAMQGAFLYFWENLWMGSCSGNVQQEQWLNCCNRIQGVYGVSLAVLLKIGDRSMMELMA
jgi:hypothetical protein